MHNDAQNLGDSPDKPGSKPDKESAFWISPSAKSLNAQSVVQQLNIWFRIEIIKQGRINAGIIRKGEMIIKQCDDRQIG